MNRCIEMEDTGPEPPMPVEVSKLFLESRKTIEF